jgi:tetratricopeptide (TPR) repeat protein
MRIRSVTQIALIVFVLLNTVCHASFAYDATEQFAVAQLLNKHHQLPQAMAKVNEVIQHSPKFSAAYALRASLYLMLEKKGALALQDVDRAIALSGPSAALYDLRAHARYQLNDLPGAIADATRGLKLNSKEDGLYRFRAKMYSLSGQHEKALADLTSAIGAQDKRQESNFRLRGDAYMRFKKYDLAVADYTSAINVMTRRDKNANELELFYSSRAAAYRKLGRKDLAAKDDAKVQKYVKDGWGAFLYEEKRER